MPEIHYELATDIVSRSNPDGTVIIMKMDESNNFFKINGIAAEVWRGLSDNKTIGEIKVNILDNYDVTPEILQNDTANLLESLLQKSLISVK